MSRTTLCKQLCDFLMQKTLMTSDKNVRDLCLTKLYDFIYDKQNVQLVTDWILKYNGRVKIPAEAAIES